MNRGTVIQTDTREKKNEHISDVFQTKGIKQLRSKLPYGDYMSLDNPRKVIERKASLSELCNNIGTNHDTFKNELKEALFYGIDVVILIEDAERNCWEDIKTWENPNRFKSTHSINGEKLFNILSTLQAFYLFDLRFCDPAETGNVILELLKAA